MNAAALVCSCFVLREEVIAPVMPIDEAPYSAEISRHVPITRAIRFPQRRTMSLGDASDGEGER